MSWTSILQAHRYWRRHRTLTEPPADLEEAERFILNKRPATPADVACILDVICANDGDARCDGLDYAALTRIRGFLAYGG